MPLPTTAAATDWHQIVELYDALLQIEPSPVVALNRAVAVAMRDGPEAGLDLIDDILAQWLFGRLPPRSRGPCRSVPSAGTNGRGPGILRTGIGIWQNRNRNVASFTNGFGNCGKDIWHSVELRTSRTTIE